MAPPAAHEATSAACPDCHTGCSGGQHTRQVINMAISGVRASKQAPEYNVDSIARDLNTIKQQSELDWLD